MEPKTSKIATIPTDFTPEKMRARMPVCDRWAYFDHAAVGPLPAPAREAILAWLDRATADGDVYWLEWSRGLTDLRHAAAELLTATPGEIALIPNTSTGICCIAEGLDWRPGDNIVFPDNEFPSNGIVWENLARRGIEVRPVPVGACGEVLLDRVASAIDARTRLVSISWVGFASGYRIDLDRVCDIVKSRNTLLMLDAIQGLGVFPIDVSKHPFDFIVADGHKWMLGPEGAGFMYVRQEHLDRIQPTMVGWGSVQAAGQFASRALRWKPDASRFEPGSYNMAGLLGLGASLRMLLEFGARHGQLATAILCITQKLQHRLRQIGAVCCGDFDDQHRSGILAFELPGKDPQQIRNRLLEAGVVTSVRQGKVRASLHAYNNQEDIERLITALQSSLDDA